MGTCYCKRHPQSWHLVAKRNVCKHYTSIPSIHSLVMTLTVRQGNTTHYKETQPQESATNPHCTVTHTHTHLYTRMGNELFTKDSNVVYIFMYVQYMQKICVYMPSCTYLSWSQRVYLLLHVETVCQRERKLYTCVSNSVYYIDTPRAQDTWMSSFKSFKSWGTIILASQISPQSLYMQYRL